jgi:tetratricopeptide (TPR) repeat protein
MRLNSPWPTNGRKNIYSVLHLAACAGLFIILLLLIWKAGRAGLSSLLSNYGASTNQLETINAAVDLSPDDPESHYLRGTVLEANSEIGEATTEYRKAASLRPDDYVLWLSLAHACELNGDTLCALDAAKQARTLAPYYAQPHWQLGNILVRAGHTEEGFAELRLAGEADRTLLPASIDLAWQLGGGDLEFVKQAFQPSTSESYLALGEYLKKRGQVLEAIAMFTSAGDRDEATQARGQYIAELISAKKFKEAYTLWKSGDAGNVAPPGSLADPGFELETNLEKPGFGWRQENKPPSLSLSLDDSHPREGKRSLKVEFKGDSNPAVPIITQLVLVEPQTHYQLNFAARTEKIVTGGPPILLVIDADSGGVLGKSQLLIQENENWRDYTIDFTTGKSATAIKISLQREACSSSPCPAFGDLWLDASSLQKL